MDEARLPDPQPAAAPEPSSPRRIDTRRAALAATLAVLIPFAVVALAWHRCGWAGCPNVDRLRAYQPGKASRLLDRKGRVFAELRPVEGETVPLKRIPKHVRDAFIAVEDQRFYEHGAVDWQRVLGAAWVNLRRFDVEEGFSTITMQLARNVFPDRIRARDRTLGRKLREIRVAYEIEDHFSKDEILELYLSHIYFGGGARGIEAASRHYFGTTAARLTLSQAAMLAGLIRGPSLYDPRRHPDRARDRRDLVIALMEHQGRVMADAAANARAAPLGVVRGHPPAAAEPGLAAYFVEQVRKEVEDRFGERVYDETLSIATTLDMDSQRAAEGELERQLHALEAGSLGRLSAPRYAPGGAPGENGTPYVQGAVVALEAATGDVLAWVGGRDFRQSRFDRVKASSRQVGSAFKPFVYAAALREGHYLSESLQDEPIRMRLEGGRVWEPKNFDEEYEGTVTMREALVRSKNVPTVRLAHAVGIGKVAGVARKSGIRSELDETPALALGTVAVSPLELTAAYAAFATLGEITAPRLVLRVLEEDGGELWKADEPKRERVLDAGVAFLVTDVLREAVDRGTGRSVRSSGFAGAAAGKTGTTNDATDAWFVGYTPRVVAAVWIGFDEPRPIMAMATGGRLAGPVWGRLMARSSLSGPSSWTRPTTVVDSLVDPESGLPLEDGCRPFSGSALRELFLRASMPRAVCPAHGDAILADSPWQLSDEDRARDFVLWPWDVRAGSEPPPPPEYEQAEDWRDRVEEWRRQRRDAGGREWEKERQQQRKETDELWRIVAKLAEKELKEWRQEQERRRRERERQRDDRDDGRDP